MTHNQAPPPPLLSKRPSAVVHVCKRARVGEQSGSDAVFQLAVVVARGRRVLLVQEKRLLVWAVLRGGGVRAQVCDGDAGGRRHLVEAGHVVAAVGGLRRAVQTRRHQAVLILRPCDLMEENNVYTRGHMIQAAETDDDAL